MGPLSLKLSLFFLFRPSTIKITHFILKLTKSNPLSPIGNCCKKVGRKSGQMPSTCLFQPAPRAQMAFHLYYSQSNKRGLKQHNQPPIFNFYAFFQRYQMYHKVHYHIKGTDLSLVIFSALLWSLQHFNIPKKHWIWPKYPWRDI